MCAHKIYQILFKSIVSSQQSPSVVGNTDIYVTNVLGKFENILN